MEATWFRDSKHPCHLSAVNGNPLLGSLCMHGPVTADSFCFVLLIDVLLSFLMTMLTSCWVVPLSGDLEGVLCSIT